MTTADHGETGHPVFARPLDGLFVLLVLGAGAMGLFWGRTAMGRPSRLLVLKGRQEGPVIDLPSEARVVEVTGPLGVSRFEVSGVTCRMLSSPCPSKLCIRAGAVSRAGTSVVCLPNRVALVLEGAPPPAAPDGVTR